MALSEPVLDSRGRLEDTRQILANKLSEYILSDADQSLIFRGKIVSLPYTYHLYINDPDGMATQVKMDIEEKLRNLFYYVEVETDVVNDPETSFSTILLFASVIDESGKKEGLGNIVEIDPSGLKKVVGILNYGDGLGFLGRL